jgi:hypothetical protein
MGNVISIVLQASGIALAIGAMRWLFAAKGPVVPRTKDDKNFYDVKWQWRALGIAGGTFWIILSLWQWVDRRSRPDAVLITMTLIFATVGIWIASGSVITNQRGITKKSLLRSRSFAWGNITEIRLHKKQGGAIELRAGSQRLVIDFRIIAFEHLLREIEDRTHLQSSNASS